MKDPIIKKNDTQEDNKDQEKSEIQEQIKENNKKMTLAIICNYLKYGYNLEEIEQYAKMEGYTIDEKDIENAKNIENGKIKIATVQFIYKVIKVIDLSYDELCAMSKSEGYIILKSRYDKAKEQIIKERNKGGDAR
ncbi:MAG: hypothetical protein ACI4VH_04935 [Clostridia bacterium]